VRDGLPLQIGLQNLARQTVLQALYLLRNAKRTYRHMFVICLRFAAILASSRSLPLIRAAPFGRLPC
jgi:hypothetical protein